jgi:hypothetical protein
MCEVLLDRVGRRRSPATTQQLSEKDQRPAGRWSSR